MKSVGRIPRRFVLSRQTSVSTRQKCLEGSHCPSEDAGDGEKAISGARGQRQLRDEGGTTNRTPLVVSTSETS